MPCKLVKIPGVGEIVRVDVHADPHRGRFPGKDCTLWGVRVKAGALSGPGCVGVVEEGFAVVCHLVAGRVDHQEGVVVLPVGVGLEFWVADCYCAAEGLGFLLGPGGGWSGGWGLEVGGYLGSGAEVVAFSCVLVVRVGDGRGEG